MPIVRRGILADHNGTTSGGAALADFLLLVTPYNAVPGEWLIAQIAVTSATVTITLPNWTPIRRTQSGSTIASALYIRKVTATEPRYHLATFDTKYQAAGAIACLGGLDPTAPVLDSTGVFTSTSTGIAIPGVTLPQVADVHVLVFTATAAGTTITDPTTWTPQARAANLSLTVSVADRTILNASTIASLTASAAAAATNIGQMVVLRLAPGTVPPSPAFQFTPTLIPYSTVAANEIPNPMRGSVEWFSSQVVAMPGRVSYRRRFWNDFETSQGVYDWSSLDTWVGWATQKGRRFQFGLNPMGGGGYTGSKVPGYLTVSPYGAWLGDLWCPNWNHAYFLERLLACFQAIATRYDKNVNFEAIDLFWYGQFGEGYLPGNAPYFATNATKQYVIDQLVAMFPNTFVYIMTDDTYSYEYARSTYPWVGARRESLGKIEHFDLRRKMGASRTLWALLRTQIYDAPFTGEWYRGSENYALTLDHIRYYGVDSVMNGNISQAYSNLTLEEQQNFILCMSTSGYRYAMTGIRGTTIRAGQQTTITSEWKNLGVSRSFLRWLIYYQFRHPSTGTVTWQSPASSLDLTKLLPTGEAPVTVLDTINIPLTVPAGSYNLHVVIVDQAGKAPNLRLAQNGKQADDSYLLGSISVLAASAGITVVDRSFTVGGKIAAGTTTGEHSLLVPLGGMLHVGQRVQSKPISIVGVGVTPPQAAAGTITLTSVAQTLADQALIAHVAIRNTGTLPRVEITPPEGWSLLIRTNKDYSVADAVFGRYAPAGGAQPFTFTLEEAVPSGGTIYTLNNVDRSSLVNVIDGSTNLSTESQILAPSLQPDVADGLLLLFVSSIGALNTITPPGEMTIQAQGKTSGVQISFATASQHLSALSPSGVKTSGFTYAAAAAASVLVIQPAIMTVEERECSFSVGAKLQAPPQIAPLGFGTEVVGSALAAQTVATSTWSPPSNTPILVAVVARRQVPLTIDSVAGNGITWTRITHDFDGGGRSQLAVFRGIGAAPTTGPTTATLSAVSDSAVILAVPLTNAATTGSGGSGAFGVPVTTKDTAQETTPSVALSTTSAQARALAIVGTRDATFAVGEGESPLRLNHRAGASSASANSSVSIEYADVPVPGQVTLDGTFAAATYWVLHAVEIKAALLQQLDASFLVSGQLRALQDLSFGVSGHLQASETAFSLGGRLESRRLSDLVDRFTGTTIDSTRWAMTAAMGATITQQEVLQIAFDTSAPGIFPVLQSAGTYDLTESGLHWQFTDFGTLDSRQRNQITLRFDSSHWIQIRIIGATLSFERRVAGVDTTIASAPLDLNANRWARIRETGGTIYAEFSPDGTTWTNPPGWNLAWQGFYTAGQLATTRVRFDSYVSTGGALSAPNTLAYDNVNALMTTHAITGASLSRSRAATDLTIRVAVPRAVAATTPNTTSLGYRVGRARFQQAGAALLITVGWRTGRARGVAATVGVEGSVLRRVVLQRTGTHSILAALAVHRQKWRTVALPTLPGAPGTTLLRRTLLRRMVPASMGLQGRLLRRTVGRRDGTAIVPIQGGLTWGGGVTTLWAAAAARRVRPVALLSSTPAIPAASLQGTSFGHRPTGAASVRVGHAIQGHQHAAAKGGAALLQVQVSLRGSVPAAPRAPTAAFDRHHPLGGAMPVRMAGAAATISGLRHPLGGSPGWNRHPAVAGLDFLHTLAQGGAVIPRRPGNHVLLRMVPMLLGAAGRRPTQHAALVRHEEVSLAAPVDLVVIPQAPDLVVQWTNPTPLVESNELIWTIDRRQWYRFPSVPATHPMLVHPQVPPGTVVTYAVRAVSGMRVSPWSSFVSGSLPVLPPPPESVRTESGFADRIRVHWTFDPQASPTAQRFEIAYALAALTWTPVAQLPIDPTQRTYQWDHVPLPRGSVYWYQIRTVGPSGPSPWSPPVPGATLPAESEVPRNMLFLGGVALYTRAGTIERGFGGGMVQATETTSGRTVAQRSAVHLTTLTVEPYPPDAATAAVLPRLLALPGVLPMILLDGTRVAVETPELRAHSVRGHYARGTDQYQTTWRVRHDVALADVFWRSATGAFAYSDLPAPLYTIQGVVDHEPDVGIVLTGNGSHLASTSIRERAAGTRFQPTLVADLTIQAVRGAATGKIGLSLPSSRDRRFGSAGIWLEWRTQGFLLWGVDPADPTGQTARVAGSVDGRVAGRYLVVLAARPGGARLEIWQNRKRMVSVGTIPWPVTLSEVPLAMLAVSEGTACLHRWYILKG